MSEHMSSNRAAAQTSPLKGGRFVISLDFELHWGVADHVEVSDYRQNLLGVREAVPQLLRLFEDNGIHATWATVGMLLARTKAELLAAMPRELPTYVHGRYSNYLLLAGVGEDEESDPFHFGHSLVSRVVSTAGQELATHTFSHYYCLEEGQRPDQFRADLQAALALSARTFGIEVRSIVFPRNQFSPTHLRICGDLGLRAFRGNPQHWLYRPRAQSDERALRRVGRLADAYLPVARVPAHVPRWGRPGDVVDVPASRFLRPSSPRLRAFDPWRARRIFGEMEAAANAGGVYHLWWHPHNFGVNLTENVAFLNGILSHYRDLHRRLGMESANMREIADELVRAA